MISLRNILKCFHRQALFQEYTGYLLKPKREVQYQLFSALRRNTARSSAMDAAKAVGAVKVKADENVEESTCVERGVSETSKRPVSRSSSPEEPSKRLKPQQDEPDGETGDRVRKKKCVIMMMYSGAGYLGMQRNRGFKTIEEDLLTALLKCNMITQEHWEQPGKLYFQRAARTDKGVSAAGQVVSVKLPLDAKERIKEINSYLPPQIRVLDIKRTTKGFDSKNKCMARTYIYVTPTFAFAPIDKVVTENFRMSEEIRKEVNRLLQLYKGTHNFHNFTAQKKPTDPSANRYIMEFECGPPFVQDDMEFCVIRVKGQSFMLHQIRKMIGLVISIMRGFTTEQFLEKAWGPDKADIPRAPGLGLMLDRLHYDAYNKKFGSDGVHESLDWTEFEEQIQKFKEEYIFSNIVKTEKEEKSMLNWLSTLHFHSYETYDVSQIQNMHRRRTAERQALTNLEEAREDETSQEEPLETAKGDTPVCSSQVGGASTDCKDTNSSVSSASLDIKSNVSGT